jgi:hypothetical protein
MAKKEVHKPTLVISILIAVVLVSAVGYFAFTSLTKQAPQITPTETQAPQVQQQEQIPENETEEEGRKSWNWVGGAGGGGSASSGADGASGPGGGVPPPDDPPEEPPNGDGTPTVRLTLDDFTYQVVSSDTARVTSITYTVVNQNVGLTNLELLIHIYDENDHASKKGLVRDQVNIGQLAYKETKTDTASVMAYYKGDISTEKTLKISLIGYISGESYNLGSVTDSVLFS